MDLGTFANILQVVTSISFFVTAFYWGKQMLKKHPVPYIALICVLGLTVVVTAISLAQKQGWLPAQKPEQVFSKIFKNEDVVLDGHEYFDCTFENVKLIYSGGYFRLERSRFVGDQTRLMGASVATGSTMNLLLMLGWIDASKIKDMRSEPFPVK